MNAKDLRLSEGNLSFYVYWALCEAHPYPMTDSLKQAFHEIAITAARRIIGAQIHESWEP